MDEEGLYPVENPLAEEEEEEEQSMFDVKVLAAGIYHNERAGQYEKLKTDQERVVFTLNVMLDYGLGPDYKTTYPMPKNAEVSKKLRYQGNKIFVEGFKKLTWLDGFNLYTKCIAFAPYPSQELALGYANRSAVLFHLGLYLECIQDIDRALDLEYPNNLRSKLYLRKIECLMNLENHSVDDMLKEAQHWLDKMSLNDTNRGKLAAKLDVLRNKTVQTELDTANRKAKTMEPSALPTIESYNNEVPCASDAVTIKYNKHYGRHVVATRNIHPGEVIAVEKPYSSILMNENIETHCYNCLRLCWANIPCNYCSYVMYCSEECRNDKWKKCHDIECAVFPALIKYGLSCDLNLFSLRLAVLALKEAGDMKELRTMLKEVDEHDDPRTKGFSRDGKLHSDKYISVYSLVTNTEKRSLFNLFNRSLDTCFILYFLATQTMIFGKLLEDLNALEKDNDITFFGGLILRHQQIISCNIFGELQEMNKYVGRSIPAVPFFSLFNHSCDPNVSRHWIPNHIVMYALYPIRKGEQLLDNYGTNIFMSKAKRQQELLKQYYFICDCILCQKNWPSYPLQSYEALVKKPEDKAKIERTLRKFNIYNTLAHEGNVQGKSYIIEDLLKMVEVLHDCVPMPCCEMSRVMETLKQVYNLMNGNMYDMPWYIYKDMLRDMQ